MVRRFCGTVLLAIAASAGAYELDAGRLKVPLEVHNPSPFARSAWPVTSGIPLPVGVLGKADEVKIVDAAGSDVPCQFRVLARYWKADRSIKWLLMDFQVDVAAKATAKYFLVRGTPAAPTRALVATRTAEGVLVDTGAIRVAFGKDGFRLMQKLWHDRNADGVYAAEELVLSAGEGDGVRLDAVAQEMERIHGTFKPWGSSYERVDADWKIPAGTHDAAARPLRVLKVEEAGPLRVVVLARGTHWSAGPGGLTDGLYDFTSRFTFFAGKPIVQVEHSVDNSRLDRWTAKRKCLPLFENLLLTTSFKLGADAKLTGGLERQSDHTLGGKAIFKPSDGKVFTAAADAKFEFYQASFGGKLWNRHRPFLGSSGPANPSTERGFKVTRDGAVVAAGDRLDGWVDLSDAKGGCTVGIRNLYLRFPKAFEVEGTTVRVSLFPKQFAHNWRVDFGERVGHTVFYAFHGPDVAGAKLRETYEALNQRLFARAEPKWYADTRAIYAEFGTTDAPIKRKRPFNEDGEWLDPGEWASQPSAGIRGYGACGGFNSGGRHRHIYSLFKTYLLTGATYDLNAALATGRWCSDHIPWVVDDFRLTGKREQVQTLFDATMMGPKDFFVAKEGFPATIYKPRFYREGPCIFYAYKGAPDQEHRGAVPAMDAYLFTGSQAAYEQIVALGNRCVLWDHWCMFTITNPAWNDRGGPDFYTMPPALPLSDVTAFDRNKLLDERWGYYSRVYGWQALSIMQAYEITGNEIYDFYNSWRMRKLLRAARRKDGLIDTDRGKVEKPWMTGIMIHGIEHAYRQSGREALRDLVIGMSDNMRLEFDYQPGKGFPYDLKILERTYKSRREWQSLASLGLAFGHQHTGHGEFLPMLREWQTKATPGNEVSVPAYFGRMGAANHVLSNPRTDTSPPAAIQDLTATLARGKITLTWTAPAEDSGRLGAYQVKLARKPLIEHAGWDRRETHRSFWAGENVAGEPKPSAPGSRETFAFTAVDTFGGFGGPAVPVSELAGGLWYVAVKTWDAAGNLSAISNVVTLTVGG